MDAPDGGWTVYVVRCSDASLYTGIARNVRARISEHNSGRGAKYTRGRRPVTLVYSESAVDRGEAQRREAEIKQLSARAKRALFGG
ncbi:MAG TPA: GIY-YIG nuclease family protein [Gammaproteobacteria bacterium]